MGLLNTSGTLVEEYSYDAWGKRRNALDWTSSVSGPFILYRGYTGHEHLDEFDLINMNGRMYDPSNGRFLSPDNTVQSPGFTQSYNRYSYCFNNPLKYIDPNGENPFIVATLFYAMYYTDWGYEMQKHYSAVAIKFNVGLGSEGYHLGVEMSVGIPKAFPISYRWHKGITFYSKTNDGGVVGNVTTSGQEVTYFGKFSVSSTEYQSFAADGSSTSQTLGQVMIGNPELNIKYQNDWQPDLLNNIALGFNLSDGGDRFRTAALQINAGQSKAGFNLFTGDPSLDPNKRDIEKGKGLHKGNYVYTYGNVDKYRSGIVYYGYGPFRIGTNSEINRHYIQNRFAHDYLLEGRIHHFQVLDRISQLNWYIGTGYGTGLW
jgi:RHS repeat-associated protein